MITVGILTLDSFGTWMVELSCMLFQWGINLTGGKQCSAEQTSIQVKQTGNWTAILLATVIGLTDYT